MPDRTSKHTQQAFADIAAQVKQWKPDKMVMFHVRTDDDSSFKKECDKWMKKQGWTRTTTGGYDSNANAYAETTLKKSNCSELVPCE